MKFCNQLGLLAALPLLLLLGCRASDPSPNLGPPPETDFVAFSTARAFDSPGTIYRRDARGTLFYVGVIDVMPEPAQSERIPSFKSEEALTVSALLKLMNVGVSGLSAGANADLKRSVTLTRSFPTGAVRERLGDAGLQVSLRNFFSANAPRTSSTYFLIRETIATKEIDLSLSKTDSNVLGGEVAFQQLISASGKISESTSSGLVIKERFEQPLRVYYKMEQVELPTRDARNESSSPRYGLKRTALPIRIDEARNKPKLLPR